MLHKHLLVIITITGLVVVWYLVCVPPSRLLLYERLCMAIWHWIAVVVTKQTGLYVRRVWHWTVVEVIIIIILFLGGGFN